MPVSDLLGGGLIPRHQLAERELLLGYLERQRELVFWKLDGLDDALARSVATPTGMTIAGIVRHLENVERGWWRRHFAGLTPADGVQLDWDDDPDCGMPVPAEPLAEVLASYRAEIARCDAVIASAGLDEVAVTRDHTLRWILVHLIEEISRHVGHLDVLAERADGRAGEEPEGAPLPGDDDAAHPTG